MQSLIDIDQKVFNWFNSFLEKNEYFDTLIKLVSVYLIYLTPVLFLFFWFYKKSEKVQKFLIELFITSVVSWQIIARFIGEAINRPRPSTFEGAKELIFHPPTYAFPSDHALFLAFIVAYLYLSGYKKAGNYILIPALLISFARIIAGFHWPADILAGWVLGILLAFLFYLIRKPIQKYIVNPLYRLATKMKLT